MHALALALLLSSAPPKAPPVECPPKAPATLTAFELAYQRAAAGERDVYVPKVPGRPAGKYLLWLEDGEVWHSRVEEAAREVRAPVPFSPSRNIFQGQSTMPAMNVRSAREASTQSQAVSPVGTYILALPAIRGFTNCRT